MKKFILICNMPLNKYDMKLGPIFQSWLYEHLPNDEVIKLHDSSLNAFSVGAYQEKKNMIFEVNTLNHYYSDLFGKILMDSNLLNIRFKNLKNVVFNIQEKRTTTVSSQQLRDIFYNEEDISKFDVYVKTPISFIQNGKYINFPDIECMFRNILSKYSYIFEDSVKVDNDLLSQIIMSTYIGRYDLHSRYFPIHKVYIPSFNGNLRIFIKGNHTIKNYVRMLLKFAEFSGVGIKTSMGMGKVIVKGEGKWMKM